MRQKITRRVPMPTQQEFASLDPVANSMLELFEGRIPTKDFKSLARVIVDTASGKMPSLRNARIKYGNPSLVKMVSGIQDSAGEYNPDRIPIQTYEKMRLDPQIKIGTALIEFPILSQNYRISCSDPKQRAYVDHVVKNIYNDTMKNLLRAIQFGFVTGQKIYDVDKFKISDTQEDGTQKNIYDDWGFYIKRIKFAHPSSIRIKRDAQEEIKWVQQDIGGYVNGKITRKPKVRIDKMVWYAIDAMYGNVFGDSRYKAAYQPWYWGQVLIQFMMRYLERRGSPSILAYAPPGFSKTSETEQVDNMEIALKTGQSLISNSVAVLPRQFDKHSKEPLWGMDLLEDKGRGEVFLEALRFLNTLKMRALLVPDKVAVAEGSSTNATAESHTDVHLLGVESTIKECETVWNNQIIPDIVEWNFPAAQRYPCEIKIERLNYSKRTIIKDIISRMLTLSGGTIKSGLTPKYLPSLKSMLDFLEIPGDVFSNLFLQEETTDDTDIEQDIKDDSGKKPKKKDKEQNSPLEKTQKKQEQNKNAPDRSERTRRSRREPERR